MRRMMDWGCWAWVLVGGLCCVRAGWCGCSIGLGLWGGMVWGGRWLVGWEVH